MTAVDREREPSGRRLGEVWVSSECGVFSEGRGCAGKEEAAGTRATCHLRAGSKSHIRTKVAPASQGTRILGRLAVRGRGRENPNVISTFSADRFAADSGLRSKIG